MSQPESRDTRRVILSGQPQVRFRAAGQVFDRIPMVNLSHGGCMAMVPFQEAGALCMGTPVTELVISHPGLTANPMTARVAWSMAQAEGNQVAVGSYELLGGFTVYNTTGLGSAADNGNSMAEGQPTAAQMFPSVYRSIILPFTIIQ